MQTYKKNGNRRAIALGWGAGLLVAGLIVLPGCQKEVEPIAIADPPPVDAPEVLPAQRAKAGVGKKGAKLMGHNDYQKMITGVPGKLLEVEQGKVLDIQVPQAIQLYKAQHGKVPRNHAQFVKEILEPNNLVLPEPRDGMTYRFNPEKGELWIYPNDELPAEK